MDLYLKKFCTLSSANYPLEDAKTAILGIPFDSTSIDRPGSRFGPNAIRAAFERFEGYNIEKKIDVYDKTKPVDIGDVEVVPGSFELTAERIEDTVKRVVEKNLFPVLLGGEHSITLPVVKAVKPDAVVSFDAHLDLRDNYLGNKNSHVTFLRRISEIVKPKNIYIVGARSSSKEELEYAEKSGINVVDKLPTLENVYLTIDIDVLDPALAPGTCSPVPGGMQYKELIKKIEPIAKNLVGFDVTEVSPLYDRAETTAYHGAKIIYDLLCLD